MSFDDQERSNYGGAPVNLYQFTLGPSAWRYCDGQVPITIGGVVYAPIAISHGEIVMSGDASLEDIRVSVSARSTVASLFVGTPPSESIHLVIKTIHYGDAEAIVAWTGIVKSGRRVSDAEFEFNCNSLMSTLGRNGLRLSWGRGCPHALYDRGCKVDPADYAVTAQITSITGNSVGSASFDTFADGYFSGGFIAFTGIHGNIERRAIESHLGSTLTLLGASDGMSIGSWVTAHPGCNRTTATCASKFNNLANYGGFPHMPNKSPFDGDPVF